MQLSLSFVYYDCKVFHLSQCKDIFRTFFYFLLFFFFKKIHCSCLTGSKSVPAIIAVSKHDRVEAS